MDINTFDPQSWSLVTKLVTDNTLIISNTNPCFANWAVEQGYRVGVVDTLYWFWSDFPVGLHRVQFYAAQCYFDPAKNQKQSRPNEDKINVTWVKTNSKLEYIPSPKTNESNIVVISFGGMKYPDGVEVPTKYAHWVLKIALPIFLSHEEIKEVHILGGHPLLKDSIPREYETDPRIKFRGFLTRSIFQQLLVDSRYQLLTPGIATLFEANGLGISPLFLQGYNSTMIIPGSDLKRGGNSVGQFCEWTFVQQVRDKWAPISEKENNGVGIDNVSWFNNNAEREGWVASKINDEAIKYSSVEVSKFQEDLQQYLASNKQPKISLPIDSDLLGAEDIVNNLLLPRN